MEEDGTPAISLAAKHLSEMEAAGISKVDNSTYGLWLNVPGVVTLPLFRADAEVPADVAEDLKKAIGQGSERGQELFNFLLADGGRMSDYFKECSSDGYKAPALDWTNILDPNRSVVTTIGVQTRDI